MGDDAIIERIKELGVDAKRLKGALDGHDNWGSLVHSFEYLTVLGVVCDAMTADRRPPPDALEPRPDAELYDGSPVHQESYRRGYRNGHEDALAVTPTANTEALRDAARRVRSFLDAWTRPYSQYDQEHVYALHVNAEFSPRVLRVSDLRTLLEASEAPADG